MQLLSRFLAVAALAAFAAECVVALRGDVAHLCCTPLQKSWNLVLGAAMLSLANYALRSVRWRQYLARLGFPFPLGFTSLTYVAGFAFTVSPGKVGEMVRAHYYNRRGVPLPLVGGAFCVERLLDMLAMTVLAALILAAAPRYHAAIWTATLLVAAALAMLALLPWGAVAEELEGRLPLGALTRLGASVARALAAGRSLLRPRVLLIGFLIGLAAWGLEGLGLYLLASIFPAAHISPAVAIGIYAVAVLVGAISFIPGGLGGTEAVMTALLVTKGYPVGDALLVTVACRLVTLWLAVGGGWAAVFILRERFAPTAAPWG